MSGETNENVINPTNFLTINVSGEELKEFVSGSDTSYEAFDALYDKALVEEDGRLISPSEIDRILGCQGIDAGLVRFDLSDMEGNYSGIRDDFSVSLRGYRVSGDPEVHFNVVSSVQFGEYYQSLKAVGTIRWTAKHGVWISGFQSRSHFENSDPFVDCRDPYIKAVAMAVMKLRRHLASLKEAE